MHQSATDEYSTAVSFHLIAASTRKEADIINVKWLHAQRTLGKTQTQMYISNHSSTAASCHHHTAEF